MGFRNPITTAEAVDTGQPTGAGVRVYQGSDETGVYGALEFRDGLEGDIPARVIGRANMVPQGGGYTQQGGGIAVTSGTYNGVSGAELELNVEPNPLGGYHPVARLAAFGGIILDGPVSTTEQITEPDPGPWETYPVAWSTSGTPPSVGNGTLRGRFRRIGRLIEVDIYLMLGSSSSAGNQDWSFTLPVQAVLGRESFLAAKAFTTGGNYAGWAYIPPGAQTIAPYLPTSSTDCRLKPVRNADATNASGTGVPQVAGSYPFLNGYNLALFGRYEAAA